MELIILLAVLVAVSDKNKQFLESVKPLAQFLESGNIRDFFQSEQFQNLQIGSTTGKTIADALNSAEQIKDFLLLMKNNPNSITESAAQLLSKSLTLDTSALRHLFNPEHDSVQEIVSSESENTPFAPIADIADKDIIFALTKYFS